jgi:pimeloyl-ACP methyl ester carboxylesterase
MKVDQCSSPDSNNVPAVVILVHGTWGRGVIPWLKKPVATWCEENSDVCKVCREELGERTVFIPFPWSGANSPAARLDASEKLAGRLAQIRKEHPSSPIFLITHSHGGNVAMYCMKDEDSRNQVAGLVCFSTPFLHVGVRNFGKSAGIIHKIITTLTFALVVVAFILLAKFVFEDETLSSSAVINWTIVILFLSLFVLAIFLGRGFRKISKWTRRLATKLSIPSELPFPVLLVRDTGDEASSALGGPQFISSVVSMFLGSVVAVLNLVNRVWAWAKAKQLPNIYKWWFITIVCVLAFLLVPQFFGLEEDELAWLAPLIVAPYAIVLFRHVINFLVLLLCVVLGFPCFVLVYFSILLLSILLIPFGSQFAISGAILKITAEATPPGSWSVTQLGTTHQPDAGIGLQHSTHSDPEALKILGDWFSQVSKHR